MNEPTVVHSRIQRLGVTITLGANYAEVDFTGLVWYTSVNNAAHAHRIANVLMCLMDGGTEDYAALRVWARRWR